MEPGAPTRQSDHDPTHEQAHHVQVVRSAPADAAVAVLLARADVARSLLAGAVLDTAAPGLTELLARGGPHARLVAALALDDVPAMLAAVEHLARAYGPVQVAATLRAVLSDGLDERMTAVRAALAGDPLAEAIVAGVPFPDQ